MKVIIEIHKELKAEEIYGDKPEYESYYKHRAEYFSPEQKENLAGIYFHLYGKSNVPFYIGIADDMLGRNWSHFDCYLNGSYWLPINPDDLSNVEDCLKANWEKDKFIKPRQPDDSIETKNLRAKSAKALIKETTVLFARVKKDGIKPAPSTQYRFLIEQVERQLQENIVDNLKIDGSWIGLKGSNRGGGKEPGAYTLAFSYADVINTKIDIGKPCHPHKISP